MPKCNDCDKSRGVTFTQGDLHLCQKCKKKRFPSGSPNTEPNQETTQASATSGVSIDQRLTEISLQVSYIPVLLKSVNDIKECQDTTSASLEYFNSLFEDFRTRIATVESENKVTKEKNEELTKRVADLEKALEDQNQYSRRENIEIHGIPETNEANENTDATVIRVLQKIDPGITPNNIEVTHRIGRKFTERDPSTPKPRPRPIIVKFSGRKIRDSVYKNKKKIINTTTDTLGYTEKNRIYINENLTPTARKLLKSANEKRKALNYKYLWTRNGFIYVKKFDATTVINIRNEHDLIKIV
ncbi:uncharacterized protein LOC144437932 [Glandiceps talaboti]